MSRFTIDDSPNKGFRNLLLNGPRRLTTSFVSALNEKLIESDGIFIDTMNVLADEISTEAESRAALADVVDLLPTPEALQTSIDDAVAAAVGAIPAGGGEDPDEPYIFKAILKRAVTSQIYIVKNTVKDSNGDTITPVLTKMTDSNRALRVQFPGLSVPASPLWLGCTMIATPIYFEATNKFPYIGTVNDDTFDVSLQTETGFFDDSWTMSIDFTIAKVAITPIAQI